MTPEEELRAAAAKLREMAAATRGGPWTLIKNIQKHSGSHMQSTWSRPGLSPQSVKPSQHDDYAWIVLMGPDKADVLADLIDEAGDLARFAAVMEGGRVRESSLSILERTALKFARAILGGQS